MLEDFKKHQAQTTPNPLGLHISKAQGSYIYDASDKAYLDLVAGVSACTLGHCHPKVVEAIQRQAESYMHVMVYGEFALEPAVNYSKVLTSYLPPSLQSVYLVNSGTEAVEGSIKLAKRITGRYELVSMRSSYHGNTMGSMSVSGMAHQKDAFRPLMPGVRFIRFNHVEDLEQITERTAAVILETIQGGAGFILPNPGYLQAVRERCSAVGAQLVFDEIQPGFGRTGRLFAFMHDEVVPDILVIGKGMASGLPCGAFVASGEKMKELQSNPKLGHITTFGGNPVVAAASLATLQALMAEGLMEQALEKEVYLRDRLQHASILEVRGKGLMLAVILKDKDTANSLILRSMNLGLLSFWLLFEPRAFRLTPPLTISFEELKFACDTILTLLDEI
ncbi:MAG: aspartate aminotransferase family protein [Flavobacteriaceae bacterium]|nr:aspartate aminotransferase family protein [Flavobacteriaceae bacterium]